ncbi:hypothetical protein Lpp78_05011 [Lacticaseibacillus paracasei subsp. paracasei CNCM I-2877]|nr:hypothetical protein Lpp78_05011 [Lacticaseibacillus paracasei subsp. paracasei CNCM I-2877]
MALMLRFLTGVVHALAETRSQAQKPAHKDLGHKWPKPSHLCPKPLMLRFLTAPDHALLLQWASQGGSLLTI